MNGDLIAYGAAAGIVIIYIALAIMAWKHLRDNDGEI